MSRDLLSGFVEEIEVRRIDRPKRAVRVELGALDELMVSIMQRGLLQPVVVRPLRNQFEIVAGSRRLEACRMLGWSKIPCHVVDLDDKEAFEASLIENIQRRTLNPIEEAEAFRRYVDDYGYGGVSEMAKRIGKSRTYVSRRIALLRLPENIRDQLVNGRTTPSVAQELLSLGCDNGEAVAEIFEKKVTRSEVRRIVSRIKDSSGFEPQTFYCMEEKRQFRINRALAKCMASIKVCMLRHDDILENLDEDEWVLKETIMHHRWIMHRQVDRLLRLNRRIHRLLPPRPLATKDQ